MQYRFNFKNHPELLKLYEKYRKMRMRVVKYSTKNSASAGNKLVNAISQHQEYGRTVLARAVYELFDPIKPLLHNADNDSYVDWDKHFGKKFEELDDDLKDDLVGLIDGDFIYELPLKFYND